MSRASDLLSFVEDQTPSHTPMSKKRLLSYGAMGAVGGLMFKHTHSLATRAREHVGSVVKPIKQSLEIWQDSPNVEVP